ncbi:hypothetical protein Xcel_2423 [Xylanimonas cellulosilytica DSM 15894]|uniref:DUF8094 domain-containing protein n=1 Tax=Xylanimonas cellulosilytica (strain DSM 15894 / JCM 12276 / CECT 5975 / KCTC 9989 / LMG 20990 / NBRC 107835 / XIL07) TaxID=446471 RepID=D1BW93_XYLCX|nr:hypothetical protein [Xylanimonas cellulosilytica]ACZ31438.1 hypothetical protein Xcel_2423 [Xylanimonas cellulosilytica DSM 15894]
MTATTTRQPGRRAAALAAVLASTLLVTGCAQTPPAPAPDPATSGPVLTLDQNARVLDAMNAAIAAGTENLDPAQLEGRVTGPALAVRTSQLEVAQTLETQDLITVLPTDYQQIILSTNETWPRTAFAITEPTDQLQPQRLLTLVQEDPRSPFKLWAWVQLRPGLRMPLFADPTIGSEVLAPDDDSLLVSPQDVVAQYADLLTTGDGSAFAETFEPAEEDPFRVLLRTVAETQTELLSADQVNGTYTFSATPRPDTPIKAVRTADGGAVVIGVLDGSEVMEAMEGAKITPGTRTAQALLQGQDEANRVTGGFVDMIALYVPPAGSDEKVILVGYSHVQTSASFG